MTSAPVILVAGAISHDYLVYPMSAQRAGLRSRPGGDDSRVVVRSGGAALVSDLLTAVAPEYGIEVLGPVAQSNGTSSYKSNATSLVDLEPQRSSVPGKLSFGVVQVRHVGDHSTWQAPPTSDAIKAAPDTVIITGSSDAPGDVESAVDLLERVRPRYIIYHMTRPLAVGRLWDVIRNGPKTSNGIPEPDHLFVVVDAEALRAEGINLSQGLSWEATSEDFVRNLGSNGRLDTLVTCPNLIVRFGSEGVIHHRGRDAVNPRLYFHPRRMECESVTATAPHMLGLTPAFTAGFALGLAGGARSDCVQAVKFGISASRRMEDLGFGNSEIDSRPDYPVDATMDRLAPDNDFAVASIPSTKISSGDKWSLFDSLTGDPAEVARQVATLGPDRALPKCPIRQFGNLLSVERAEQERLAAVHDIVEERISADETTPTCIGIFGPAGSGKKFTARSLADHIGGERPVSRLNYDARTLRPEDFCSACHTIRDASATGSLPIVTFKNIGELLESDTDNAMTLYLLQLMESGTFADHGHERNLGHAILIFLVDQEHVDSDVAATPVATEFALRRRPTTPSAAEWKSMASSESPLMDTLHGVINVLGPNATGRDDKMFTIRRALMLRQLIKQKHPHMEINGVINFDDAVLHALLLTPHFKHGLGSLEKIISTSRLSHRTKFEVSALPPEEQIQLHVDGKIFMSFLRAPKLPPALRERLAQGLFEAYKKQRLIMAKSDAERKSLESDRSYCDWEDLSGELKESTRAQADDIPRKLRATGCFMLNDGGAEPRGEPLVPVPKFGEEELLMLGEMEHERFNAERLQRQWRTGPRNSKQRTTPFLVPWRDLEYEWQVVDMAMVEVVPKILEGAGWRIYRMQS